MHDEFNALLADTRDDISNLVDGYVSGHLTPQDFGDQMAALLEDKHAEAAMIGRQHAGDSAPLDDDKAFAAQVVDGEAEYLASFVKDLEAGRYLDERGLEQSDAINQRAGMYGNRLVGTANESWALAQDAETGITWNLSAQNNCDDCIELADGSPYTADSLPTSPGAGDTICITNCGCFLTNDAGQEGFRLPDADEE